MKQVRLGIHAAWQVIRKTSSSLKSDGIVATSHKIYKRLFSRYDARLKRLLPENRWGDQAYGFLLFYASHSRRPNNCMTFNDVLYRIKTTDEILDPLRVFVTDKEFVKLYVKSVVGDEYNVPTIAVLRSIDEARAYSFPSQCCIKPTHSSGEIILRKGGEPIEYNKIESWFSQNYYRSGREANYRLLKPKVIVEPIIFANETTLVEYKMFCSYGEPRLIRTTEDSLGDNRCNLFDVEWNSMPFAFRRENSPKPQSRPVNLLDMINIAKKLSEPFNFIRVDLYSNNKRIYVGELTHCPGNAMNPFIPTDSEKIASEIIFNNGSY
ncbi:MAG TPA: ATP-grasp fold amidoligase family protein [Pseudolabrys sp.]|nr:ATP-grasp fold amidoligase family protein [Pseudolabrys sp.]